MHTHPNQTRNSCSGWLWLVSVVRFHVVLGSVEIRGVVLLAQGTRVSASSGQLHIELVEIAIPVVVVLVAWREWIAGDGFTVRSSGFRHVSDCLPVRFLQGDDVEHGLDICYCFCSCLGNADVPRALVRQMARIRIPVFTGMGQLQIHPPGIRNGVFGNPL